MVLPGAQVLWIFKSQMAARRALLAEDRSTHARSVAPAACRLKQKTILFYKAK